MHPWPLSLSPRPAAPRAAGARVAARARPHGEAEEKSQGRGHPLRPQKGRGVDVVVVDVGGE